MSKLTYDDLEQIYYLHDKYGFNSHDLASRFKVAPKSVQHFLRPGVRKEVEYEIQFRKQDSRTEFQRAVQELGLIYDPNIGYILPETNTPIRATGIVTYWKQKNGS